MLGTGPVLLNAQIIPGPPPTAAECRSAERALVQGNRAGLEILPGCGSDGGFALARALLDARSETDPAYLGRLYGAMSSIRDPAVFGTALNVILDQKASDQVRATAILIAVSQHDVSLTPRLNVSFADLISPASKASCRLSWASDQSYRSKSRLPSAYFEQFGKALLQLLSAPATPAMVRKFAECARPVARETIADAIPASSIRLSYVCDNRFRIKNKSIEDIRVTWRTQRDSDQGDVDLPSKGQVVFTTERPDSTSLYHRGKLVQTVANENEPCSTYRGSIPGDSLRRLYHERNSGAMRRGREIVRDSVSWRAVWARLGLANIDDAEPPPIDFSKQMVVIAAMGALPSTGYDVTIDSVKTTRSNSLVFISSEEPGGGCAVGAAETEPVDVVAVARNNLPVRFVERVVVSQCRD